MEEQKLVNISVFIQEMINKFMEGVRKWVTFLKNRISERYGTIQRAHNIALYNKKLKKRKELFEKKKVKKKKRMK